VTGGRDERIGSVLTIGHSTVPSAFMNPAASSRPHAMMCTCHALPTKHLMECMLCFTTQWHRRENKLSQELAIFGSEAHWPLPQP
jgi:hypothetical protein